MVSSYEMCRIPRQIIVIILKIAKDIFMESEGVAEQFLIYAKPTTILIVRQHSETIIVYIKNYAERSVKVNICLYILHLRS